MALFSMGEFMSKQYDICIRALLDEKDIEAKVRIERKINAAQATTIAALFTQQSQKHGIPIDFIVTLFCDAFALDDPSSLPKGNYAHALVWISDWFPPSFN